MKVLAYGEILWDIIEGCEYLGGAPYNFAAHFVKCGGESSIISAVGNDERGRKALQKAGGHGIDGVLVQHSPSHPTGTVDVTLNDGEPDYVIHRDVAYDSISFQNGFDRLDSRFEVFYFGSLIQRSEVSQKTLSQILSSNRFKHIFYDVNVRKDCYSTDIITRSLGFCSILKLNVDELKTVSEAAFGQALSADLFSERLIKAYRNIHTVIITAGKDGCTVYTPDGSERVPGISVKVADAVGAGDAFSAAFVYTLLKERDPFLAARTANHVGAFVAGERGPIPEYTEAIRSLISTST